ARLQPLPDGHRHRLHGDRLDVGGRGLTGSSLYISHTGSTHPEPGAPLRSAGRPIDRRHRRNRGNGPHRDLARAPKSSSRPGGEPMPTPNLNNKVALITGAAGGFGRVLVRAFLDHGARVAALDIDEAGLARLKREVPSARKAALLTSVTDIADYAACEKAIARTVRGLGGLDVLVNNGAMGMGVIRADHLARPVPIDEVAPEVWQRMVAVNFSGAWHMTRAAVPHMLGKRWGRIVNVTTSFFTMLRGGFHPYGPCKAG